MNTMENPSLILALLNQSWSLKTMYIQIRWLLQISLHWARTLGDQFSHGVAHIMREQNMCRMVKILCHITCSLPRYRSACTSTRSQPTLLCPLEASTNLRLFIEKSLMAPEQADVFHHCSENLRDMFSLKIAHDRSSFVAFSYTCTILQVIIFKTSERACQMHPPLTRIRLCIWNILSVAVKIDRDSKPS